MTTTVPRPRLLPAAAVVLAMAVLTAACGKGGDGPAVVKEGGADASTETAAQVASYELVAGRSGRFIVGLLAADQTRLVAFGTVQLRFAYLGDRGTGKPAGPEGPAVTARFLPIPGQEIDPADSGPRFVQGSEGTGVYGAPDVTFDRPGFWQVSASATIEGRPTKATAAFEVLERSPIPATGDPAPRTENPVAGTPGVEPASIDSRAAGDAPIPDPELHATTVAAAVDAKRPLMVVVSTPTYCQSRFCGPITDSVSALAKRYGNRMAFVHLEVWKNFDKSEVNQAAAEWIYPPGTKDPREPWVFVIGRDGRITHRFDNVATDAELEQATAEVTR